MQLIRDTCRIAATVANTGRERWPIQSPWLSAVVVPVVLAPVWLLLESQAQIGLPLFTVAGLILLLAAAVVTVTDIDSYRIPNWVTYSAFAWGIAINGAATTRVGALYAEPLGAVGLSQSLLGALVLFGVMLLVFSFTGGGAGDVKLVAAVGALLGAGRGVDAVACAIALAGIGAIVAAVTRHGPRQVIDSAIRPIAWRLFPLWVDAPGSRHYQMLRSPMPLGPFFAIGIIVVLLDAGPGIQSFTTY